ncbi:MAG: peptidylprolyl isomerase [Enterobacteriaceae bacterium]
MKPNVLISALLAFGLASSPLWTSAETVKNKEVDQTLVQLLLNDQGLKGSAKQRAAIEQQLALQTVIIQKAEQLGIDKQTEIQERIEMARRLILVQAYWKDYFSKNPITEENIKSAYDQLRNINGNQQYQLSHIVVNNMTSAQKAITMLKKKTSFAEVAAKLSVDSNSKSKGGALGWQWKTDINPLVFEKISTAKVGKVSEPIQVTPDSIVIVKLDNTRTQDFPAYAQVKPNIQAMLQQQIEQQQLEKMTK